jgi:hypothetical protein
MDTSLILFRMYVPVALYYELRGVVSWTLHEAGGILYQVNESHALKEGSAPWICNIWNSLSDVWWPKYKSKSHLSS